MLKMSFVLNSPPPDGGDIACERRLEVGERNFEISREASPKWGNSLVQPAEIRTCPQIMQMNFNQTLHEERIFGSLESDGKTFFSKSHIFHDILFVSLSAKKSRPSKTQHALFPFLEKQGGRKERKKGKK